MISYTLGICKKFKKARDNFEIYKNLRINWPILRRVEIKYILKSLYQRIINFL
ncbi:hypothetical protein LEP1GSC059_3359 [Leptospira noguchii serovar Panama str. CZ214]|uniref:Uncharacterized protein n=1 Tax=Leptospira noguchii serovar Panama str. CZ214 TaxID=1001595 RepID=T0H021_9LEPT|nr:hypothetical protein LEP1GSC059_3359 [Leptospira noguchii serovar Panama str. CZ214]